MNPDTGEFHELDKAFDTIQQSGKKIPSHWPIFVIGDDYSIVIGGAEGNYRLTRIQGKDLVFAALGSSKFPLPEYIGCVFEFEGHTFKVRKCSGIELFARPSLGRPYRYLR